MHLTGNYRVVIIKNVIKKKYFKSVTDKDRYQGLEVFDVYLWTRLLNYAVNYFYPFCQPDVAKGKVSIMLT